MSQPVSGGRYCPVCFKSGPACQCGAEPLKCPACGNTHMIEQTTLGHAGAPRRDPNMAICRCGARGNVDDWREIARLRAALAVA